MDILKDFLTERVRRLPISVRRLMKSDLSKYQQSLFPDYFTNYVTVCLHYGAISMPEYHSLVEDFMYRNPNYRIFMVVDHTKMVHFCTQFIQTYAPKIKSANNVLDKYYSKDYNFIYRNIKISSSTSRVTMALDYTGKDAKRLAREVRLRNKSLAERGLKRDSTYPFKLSFQRLHPELCDVFIWFGIWLDGVRVWVLSVKDYHALTKRKEVTQTRGSREKIYTVCSSKLDEKLGQYEIDPKDLFITVLQKYAELTIEEDYSVVADYTSSDNDVYDDNVDVFTIGKSDKKSKPRVKAKAK